MKAHHRHTGFANLPALVAEPDCCAHGAPHTDEPSRERLFSLACSLLNESLPGRKNHNSTMGDEGRPLLLDVSSNQMQPLPWDPRRAKISGRFIILSVALERLAYYAVVINLFLYLNRGQTEVLLYFYLLISNHSKLMYL